MLNSLSERFEIRCMPGTRRHMRRLMRAFPGRFDNESHFIRAAIVNFIIRLDKERRELKR